MSRMCRVRLIHVAFQGNEEWKKLPDWGHRPDKAPGLARKVYLVLRLWRISNKPEGDGRRWPNAGLPDIAIDNRNGVSSPLA